LQQDSGRKTPVQIAKKRSSNNEKQGAEHPVLSDFYGFSINTFLGILAGYWGLNSYETYYSSFCKVLLEISSKITK